MQGVEWIAHNSITAVFSWIRAVLELTCCYVTPRGEIEHTRISRPLPRMYKAALSSEFTSQPGEERGRTLEVNFKH